MARDLGLNLLPSLDNSVSQYSHAENSVQTCKTSAVSHYTPHHSVINTFRDVYISHYCKWLVMDLVPKHWSLHYGESKSEIQQDNLH